MAGGRDILIESIPIKASPFQSDQAYACRPKPHGAPDVVVVLPRSSLKLALPVVENMVTRVQKHLGCHFAPNSYLDSRED